ncbi:MAG: hypothetical protein H8D58_01475 [Candidatus Marinimicrobia bacterium]|nr:hypothetical protein [Candidatus Neomarinimicrobiota bacterium]
MNTYAMEFGQIEQLNQIKSPYTLIDSGIIVGDETNPNQYATYTYNFDGSMNKETLHPTAGERSHLYTYNSQGQLHTINPSATMGLLENLTYSPSGNIESAHILLGSEGGNVYTDIIYDYTTDYAYDDFGQLISAVNTDNAIVNLDEMTYDPNGNITLKNEGGTE